MKNNSIKVVKLINGMDLVGEVEKRKNDVFIRRPMNCKMVIRGETVNVEMAPYCVLSQSNWAIFQNSHVLNVLEPRKEVVAHYNQNFSKPKKGMGLTVNKNEIK